MSEEIQMVTCPECREEASDFGSNMRCEFCGHAPMPYHELDGTLVN